MCLTDIGIPLEHITVLWRNRFDSVSPGSRGLMTVSDGGSLTHYGQISGHGPLSPDLIFMAHGLPIALR